MLYVRQLYQVLFIPSYIRTPCLLLAYCIVALLYSAPRVVHRPRLPSTYITHTTACRRIRVKSSARYSRKFKFLCCTFYVIKSSSINTYCKVVVESVVEQNSRLDDHGHVVAINNLIPIHEAETFSLQPSSLYLTEVFLLSHIHYQLQQNDQAFNCPYHCCCSCILGKCICPI